MNGFYNETARDRARRVKRLHREVRRGEYRRSGDAIARAMLDQRDGENDSRNARVNAVRQYLSEAENGVGASHPGTEIDRKRNSRWMSESPDRASATPWKPWLVGALCVGLAVWAGWLVAAVSGVGDW